VVHAVEPRCDHPAGLRCGSPTGPGGGRPGKRKRPRFVARRRDFLRSAIWRDDLVLGDGGPPVPTRGVPRGSSNSTSSPLEVVGSGPRSLASSDRRPAEQLHARIEGQLGQLPHRAKAQPRALWGELVEGPAGSAGHAGKTRRGSPPAESSSSKVRPLMASPGMVVGQVPGCDLAMDDRVSTVRPHR